MYILSTVLVLLTRDYKCALYMYHNTYNIHVLYYEWGSNKYNSKHLPYKLYVDACTYLVIIGLFHHSPTFPLHPPPQPSPPTSPLTPLTTHALPWPPEEECREVDRE